MNYVGIDIHKHYSVLVAVDERGQELARGRVKGNTPSGFLNFLRRCLDRAKRFWKRVGTGVAFTMS